MGPTAVRFTDPPALADGLHKSFSVPPWGTFVLHRPSYRDYWRIGSHRASLIGPGLSQQDNEWWMAHAIAILEVLADTKPRDFSVDRTIEDPDALDVLWTFVREYDEWLGSFRPNRGAKSPAGAPVDPNSGASGA